MKRLLDIVLALIGLIIASPVMLVISVLLRIDSSGETFFSQKRLGKNGKIFKIHKFRKFPQNWGTKGAGVTTQNDVRMTSFGAFLERTKLDELPQLWNILKGEMSFVGPRPESIRYKDLFEGEFKKLLDYTPGIFGPNQAEFRNESAMYPADEDPEEFYKRELFPRKAKNDIAYFANASFLSDLKWMFKSTLGTIIGIFDWQRIRRRYALAVVIDVAFLQIAWLIAHIFRFEGLNLSLANKEVYFTGCWLIPLVVIPLMLLGGCYRHPYRYFAVRDAVRLVTVTCSAWFVAVFIQFGFFQRNFSIGIAILALFVFICLMALPRLYRREKWIREHPPQKPEQRKILIYGAGKKGGALVKFLEQGFSNVKIVGLLDEDSELHGRHINGVKVLGGWRDRNTIVSKVQASEIWVTEHSAVVNHIALKEWVVGIGLQYKSVAEL